MAEYEVGATFVQGGDAIDYTPSGALAAGAVVVLGTLFGVTKRAIAAGALGAIHIVGVFNLPKAPGSATALTVGLSVYWDAMNEVVTLTVGSNVYVGKVVAAADDDDETVAVGLKGFAL